MIGLLSWNRFLQSQIDAHRTFMTKDIVWLRRKGRIRTRYGEDPPEDYDRIIIKGLLNYNYMRSWPPELATETGTLDRQSIQVLLSKPLLKAQGYLTPEGNLDYDVGFDKFEINGKIHFPAGDTPASQIENIGGLGDLLYTLIVRPEDLATQEKNR